MISEQLVDELKQEAVKTRQLMERLPERKLAWTPHPKSMTLGQLAWHVAVLPRGIADLVTELNVGRDAIRDAPGRGAAHADVESHVSPSRPGDRVSAAPRRSGAGDVRADSGRESVWMSASGFGFYVE